MKIKNLRWTAFFILCLVLSGCAQTGPAAKETPLFDGQTLNGWIDLENKGEAKGWIVKDGAMASTGAGRGVIYTAKDYSRYRLMFTMRHLSGKPNHEACLLIFCARPQEGVKPLDALGGIQFQVPDGYSWDYRPGHNNAGKGGYTSFKHAKFDQKEWSRIELLVDATTGTARMAVAQPVGAKAIEVLDFHVPEAGRPGPIAWQMHNAGLFDEYKERHHRSQPVQQRPDHDKVAGIPRFFRSNSPFTQEDPCSKLAPLVRVLSFGQKVRFAREQICQFLLLRLL